MHERFYFHGAADGNQRRRRSVVGLQRRRRGAERLAFVERAERPGSHNSITVSVPLSLFWRETTPLIASVRLGTGASIGETIGTRSPM